MIRKDEPLRKRLLEQILGPDAVLWQNTPDDPRTYEVRCDGKHVGFIQVTCEGEGEVVWL